MNLSFPAIKGHKAIARPVDAFLLKQWMHVNAVEADNELLPSTVSCMIQVTIEPSLMK